MADDIKIRADFDMDGDLDEVWAGRADKLNANYLGAGLENILDGNITRLSVKPATAESIGGVKIGEGIAVEADGTISVEAVSLFDAEDKARLDGMEDGANNYIHPDNHAATVITEDATHRFFTDDERTKLTGIDPGANNYTHPATHSPDIILETTDKQFISSAEKQLIASIDPEGGVSDYVHPASHPASMIVEDANRRFFTDAERTKLTAIPEDATNVEASAVNGNIKINNVENTVYTHPVNHAATVITEDATHRFFTDAERTKLTAIKTEDRGFLSIIQSAYSNITLDYNYNGSDLTSISISGDITATIVYTYTNGNLTREVASITSPFSKTVTINYTYTNGLLTREARTIS